MNQELLHEIFDYDNGNLRWKVAPRRGVSVGTVAGSMQNTGYLSTSIKRKKYLIHRLVFLYHNGYLPQLIDHIDGNTLNNKIENLREASKANNQWNQKKPCTNKSGVKGVSWHRDLRKWRATCKVNGKYNYLGSFDNIEDAALAVQKFRNIAHEEYAKHE